VYSHIVKTIAITIEEDILERIDRLNAKHGGSSNRSRVIRAAVKEYLLRAERLAEEEREREIFRRNKARLSRQAAVLVKEQGKP
jgi:metal-responsive CopG/Arc/MetJ family transcriptional regulator